MSTLRLSCQEQLLPGARLQDKWETAASWGFDALELRGRGDGAFAARLPELRQAAADGVHMPSVCVEMSHFVGDFDADRRRDAVDQMGQQLDVMGEIGGLLAMTPASWGMFSRRLPPFEPPRSRDDDHAILVDAFGTLAARARSAGVLICLEPLNRYEDHMVNTLAQAAALCREVGSPAFKVAADTYHMNIEEADPARALVDVADQIGHIQLSDSNRYEPGAGHLDWTLLLATIDAIGYDGTLAYECRLSGVAEHVLPRSTSLMRRLA